MTSSQSLGDLGGLGDLGDLGGLGDEECWVQLEEYRLLLIKSIQPAQITPYLRQCRVLSSEDEEQILNDPNLVTRRRKVGALLDTLQRMGVKGYVAFLESLELDYPQLYRKITGKEPARVFSILVDTVGESGLTQFLMSEVSRLQNALKEERRRRQEAAADAASQEEVRGQQQVRERELRKQQERVQRIREERERLWEELRQLKDDNYSLMHDVAKLSQEKNNALMSNRDLQIEVEKLKHSLMNAESDSKIHRRRTLTLRSAMEARPTPDDLLQLQRRNDLLSALVTKLETTQQQEGQESVEEVKQHSVFQQQQLLTQIHSLKADLLHAEEQQARQQAEQQQLKALRCSTLRKDAQMYRQRMDDIIIQMDEVIRERDKALASREEVYQDSGRVLQQVDQYRRRLREVAEQRDELQVELFRTEGEVLALKTRLRRHQRSQSSEEESREKFTTASSEEPSLPSGECDDDDDDDDDEEDEKSSADVPGDDLSACCKPRGRCNFYYRRKRALRSKAISRDPAPCDLGNSSGSDNTDTDGM